MQHPDLLLQYLSETLNIPLKHLNTWNIRLQHAFFTLLPCDVKQSWKQSGPASRRQRMVAWPSSGLLHRNDDLCATSELYTGELHHTDEPLFSQAVRRYCVETAYCKRLFVCFKYFISMLQKYIRMLQWCFKCMLQMFHSVFKCMLQG
jgi:hypothetical protein